MSITAEIEDNRAKRVAMSNTKQDIKSAVNTDFEAINNEQIEQYPSLIRNAINQYKSYIPVVTGEDKQVSLNTVPLKAKEFAVIGDTFQQQYEGKNLFNSLNLWEPVRVSNGIPIVATITNITISNNETTQCIYSKTSTTNAVGVKSNFLNLKAGISYIISFSLNVPEGTTVYMNLNTYSNNTYERVVNLGGVTQSGRYEMSYTPVVDTQICLISYIGGGFTVNNLKVYDIQLEQGSTATDYEPFVGGTESPNPDFPQPIKVVTGNQTVVKRGKNLIDITTLQNGYISSAGGVVESHSQAEKYSQYIKVTPSTTYTFSIIETTDTYDNWFGVGQYSDTIQSSFVKRSTMTVASQKYITFTTDSTVNYIRVSARNLANATKIMLVEGNIVPTAETYEPYITPVELPLALKSKNIFNPNSTRHNAYISSTVAGNTVAYTNSNATYIYDRCTKIVNGKTYTISWTQGTTPASTNARLGVIANENNVILRNITTWLNSSTYITFTANYSGFLFLASDINATNIQIEENSTATTYTNYYNYELCKIGEYQDILFKNKQGSKYYNAELEENAWYKFEKIRKIICDGTESWTKNNSYVGVYYHNYGSNSFVANAGLSDYYPYHNGYSQYDYAVYTNTGAVVFRNKDINTSANDFKASLQANPVTVYAVRQTAIYTKITDTTLISQLESIENTNMNNGTTVIYAENEEGLQPTLYVKAYKKIEE